MEDEDAAQIVGQTPFLLALAGFVPFAILTGAQFVPGATFAHTTGLLALNVYAAIILSFLGGIRWGLAVQSGGANVQIAPFVVSVVPSLWAWAAFFAPQPWGFVAYAIGFAAMGWLDRALVAAGKAPGWFGLLRVTLTLLVAPTLLVAALSQIM